MRSTRAVRRAGVSLAATLPLLAGALALGIPAAHAADAPGRDTLVGTRPAWATAKADKGATSDGSKVTARVYLAGRDANGLAAYAKAVSDPTSAAYGKYLTAAQVQQRFGASPAQVAAVKAWLKASGLTVTGVTAHYVTVTGDVAAAEKAFSTQLHNYAKGKKTYRAPSRTASAPDSLKGAVLTVTGLDNAPHTATHDDTLPAPETVFRNAGPFSTYYGSNTAASLPTAYGAQIPYAVQGYTGKQLRAAYGAGKWTGKKVRVAITDAYASPYIAADAATYAAKQGDAPYRAGQLKQVLPKGYTNTEDCSAAGWYGEETLDVEAVHAVAPAADITYVGSASCMDDDLIDSLSKVVDKHLADIVSNSWGAAEADETPDLAAAYDQVFELGAVQGIGFYFSSGDNGDEVVNTGQKQVDTPANSAWVTAVGGTSLAVGRGDKYQWETGWGTEKASLSADGKTWTNFPGAYTSGAGGGTSATVAAPFYQKGRVPDYLAKANSDEGQPGRPGHRGDRRPEHRIPGRPDPDPAEGRHRVRRVPHRRYVPGGTGDRGRAGPRAGGPRRQGDRLRQPGDLLDVRLAREGLPRRDRQPHRVRTRRGTPGLHQRLRRHGRDPHLRPQPRQGQLAAGRTRLRRRDRRGFAREGLRGVVPPLRR